MEQEQRQDPRDFRIRELEQALTRSQVVCQHLEERLVAVSVQRDSNAQVGFRLQAELRELKVRVDKQAGEIGELNNTARALEERQAELDGEVEEATEEPGPGPGRGRR